MCSWLPMWIDSFSHYWFTVLQWVHQYLRLPFYTTNLILLVECLNPIDMEAPGDTEKLEMCVGVSLDNVASVTVEVSGTGLPRVWLKPKVNSANEAGCLLCP